MDRFVKFTVVCVKLNLSFYHFKDYQKFLNNTFNNLKEEPPIDTHEMIGSTKSLIPLSPATESGASDRTYDDEKAARCDAPEKPLVEL